MQKTKKEDIYILCFCENKKRLPEGSLGEGAANDAEKRE
jgi:hypothetical protein